MSGAQSAINTLLPQGLSAIAGAGLGGSHLGQSDELGRGLNIRLVPANGGTIISIRDENHYSAQSSLYVVSEGQDIGAELSKIITLHYLKK